MAWGSGKKNKKKALCRQDKIMYAEDKINMGD